MIRLCAHCKATFETFIKSGAGFSYCKECRSKFRKHQWATQKDTIAQQNRRSRIKSKYGLSKEQYESMYKSQGGRCAICPRHGRLAVDHSHITGKIRGLLCISCNTALGMFQDDTEILTNAITYLSK